MTRETFHIDCPECGKKVKVEYYHKGAINPYGSGYGMPEEEGVEVVDRSEDCTCEWTEEQRRIINDKAYKMVEERKKEERERKEFEEELKQKEEELGLPPEVQKEREKYFKNKEEIK